MWKTKGTIPYFISMFASTFVLMGHFIFTQMVIADTYAADEFLLESALLQGLFLLPFIFMIVPASFLSNKFPKSRVITWTSVVMAIAMLCIAIFYTLGFAQLGYWFTLLLAAAFAVHSPAKYGILKEMYGTRHLGYVNAYLQVFSVGALIFASWMMFFGLAFGRSAFDSIPTITELLSKTVALPWILFGASVVAAVFAFFIPKVGREYASMKMPSAVRTVKSTWANPVVRACIVGLSIFWGMAQVFVLVFQDTSNSANLATLKDCLSFTLLGLIISSFLVARASRDFIETGMVPMGALGTSLCMLFIPFTVHPILLAILFSLTGFFGGIFIVTLNSLLQYYTRPTNSGRILAVNNLLQVVALGIFLGLDYIVLRFTPIKTQHLFLALAVISFVGFAYAIRKLPQALLRILLRAFFSRYKLKALGVQHIPHEGPILLVGNHFSFIDWAVLQMASPRALRVVSNKDHFEKWYLRWVLKRLGMIRIHRKNPDAAMKTIHEALMNGEAVAVFPEGEVAKSPHIGPFMVDFSSAIKDTNASIIPFYIQGLWGSRYSYTSDVVLFGPASTRIITVAFGAALPGDTPPNTIRNVVREISIDAWGHSLKFYKPLASTWLRACKKIVKSGPTIYSPDGAHLSGYRLLCATLAFSRVFKKSLARQKNIGIMLPPSAAGVIANLSCWVLGKVNVNLNYTSAPDIVASCIAKAEIKTVITSHQFLEKLKIKGVDYSVLSNDAELVYAEDIMKGIPKAVMLFHMLTGFILPPFFIELFYYKRVKLFDTAAILFSSGTEGMPKGVELTHYNMMGNIQQMSCIFNVTKNDVMLAELPLFHSFGLTVTVLLNLVEGSPIITVADPTDIKTMARVCAEFKATVLIGTPTFIRAFTVNRWVHPMVFKHMRIIIAGAEKLRPEIQEAFRLKFGKEVFEGYGCTETTPVASVNTENILLDDYMTMQVNNKIGTVGMPLPGTLYRIVDPETNEELPIGQDGMILVGGCQVMKGYFKNSSLTSEAILELNGKRWYRTGDKGHVDEDGFLTIVDRYSRFAKLGGEMISLGAVEIRINETKILEGCEYMVTAIPDSAKGECVVLLYSGEKDVDVVLRELRKSGIPPLMVPGLAFKVDDVPKLGTGKADFAKSKSLALNLAAHN